LPVKGLMAGWGAGLAGRGWAVAKGARVVAGQFARRTGS